MGLFYEVAKGVLKKPRSVAKRVLGKMQDWESFVIQPEVVEKPPARWRQEREALRLEVEEARAKAIREKYKEVGERKRYIFQEDVSDPVRGSNPRSYLFPPEVRPEIDVSSEQWKAYVKRMLSKEPSGKSDVYLNALGKPVEQPLSEGAVATRELVESYTPPGEPKIFSRLKEKYTVPEEPGVIKTKYYDLPYEEARLKLIEDAPEFGGPGKLQPYGQHIPPVKVLRQEGEQPVYEMRKFRDLGAEMRSILSRGQKSVERTQATKIAKEGGEPLSAAELAQKAAIADSMWKFIGGGRTLIGKEWNHFRETSRGKFKVKDTRDYFTRVAMKWLADPQTTLKTYPREARSLEQIWAKFQQFIQE